MLIVYGLIGRYTMADLQEDRSLVRNLLSRASTSRWSIGASPTAPTAG